MNRDAKTREGLIPSRRVAPAGARSDFDLVRGPGLECASVIPCSSRSFAPLRFTGLTGSAGAGAGVFDFGFSTCEGGTGCHATEWTSAESRIDSLRPSGTSSRPASAPLPSLDGCQTQNCNSKPRRRQTPSTHPMPSFLFLVRHAHAAEAANDAERPLSKRGREQLRDLARFLRETGAFAPEEIWHSPLVRASETAEILGDRLKLKADRIEVSELEPGVAPELVAGRLRGAAKSVALVGHEPQLSALASLLVTGRGDPAVFVLKKAAILALEPATEGRWAVRWQLAPELLPGRRKA